MSGHNRASLLAQLDEDDRLTLRGCGGPRAGAWLLPRQPGDPVIPDKHFVVDLKFRLGVDVCPPGARCRHRYAQDGTYCNEPLDSKGWHARKCGVGCSRTARHDALRDWHAPHHQQLTGYTATREQRVPPWDRVDPRSGEVKEAVLDVCTRDAVSGRPIYCDWTVTCEHSTYQPRRAALSNRDGKAAKEEADEKHRRYPPEHGELAALALETGGRPGDETVAFVRGYGHGLPDAERSEAISTTWRQISRTLQVGSADMVLSALARGGQG